MSEQSAVAESGRPTQASVAPAEWPARSRLEDQIAWYDGKSQHNQSAFKRLKLCQIVLAAAIPVAAAAGASSWLMGGAGGAIVVLEGVQQLQQYQQNWTAYRSTCERLKHEKYLFAAQAGPYAAAPRPDALLAERVEGLVSQEHAAWTAHREEAAHQLGDSR